MALSRFFITIFFIIALSSCNQGPTMFDLSEKQFKSLTPSQQAQVIEAYNERQLIKTENLPLETALGLGRSNIRPKVGASFPSV